MYAYEIFVLKTNLLSMTGTWEMLVTLTSFVGMYSTFSACHLLIQSSVITRNYN